MRYGNYDNWKLATPWDDVVEIEVYKVEEYEYFTHDDKLANKFDDIMLQYKYHVVQKEYDDRQEYLEECADNLADDLGLSYSENDALISYQENEYSEYLDAVENGYKGKFKRRFR